MPNTLQGQAEMPSWMRSLLSLLFVGTGIYLVMKDNIAGWKWQSTIHDGDIAQAKNLLDRGYDINAPFTVECFVGGSGWIGGALPPSRTEQHTALSYALYIRSMRMDSHDDGMVEFLRQAGAKLLNGDGEIIPEAATFMIIESQAQMPALEPIPANRAIINRIPQLLSLGETATQNPSVQAGPTNHIVPYHYSIQSLGMGG